ncbi:sensor histidine kinase [Ochrobactrum sp. POC9]|uniref:GAF domain-containing sensor histidine kinase n=1 Tax=unclassified Ochrobactrum TaxID=239106 RepID=UPI000D7081F0|nr:GAF domain-containing sensor histidine kinase [Ochrobactrum sp. POC9]MCH4542615.1 GAF domain-containing sensor histidine kinase [Ochrobactrum sp. A-1]PWU76247.1 sensor histidine kinase [Ochrobactrum sp. POC9]
MAELAPQRLLDHYLNISRLLAGQLDFDSIIQAVAAEITHIVPYDHLDVCIKMLDGKFHIAYEAGIATAWSRNPPALLSGSPIRTLLSGEAGYLLTDDARADPRFHFEGSFSSPIIDHDLKGRLHVPLKAQGDIIGALSCSSLMPACYKLRDVENAQSIADLLAPYFFAIRAAEQAKRSAIVETEARAREEGLRFGALKLTEALETERHRIGMDLHDQTLADLTRLARHVERLTHAPDLSGEQLEPLFRGLQHCMHDLRQIIEEAKPSILQLFGFVQATENHLDRSVRDSGSSIEWTLDDHSEGMADRLEETVATSLFRIVQEAINNTIRHAHASRLRVMFRDKGGRLHVEVADDGIGMDRQMQRPGGGLGGGHGIDNMRTRARLISASFAIRKNAEGGGTSVTIHLPAEMCREAGE